MRPTSRSVRSAAADPRLLGWLCLAICTLAPLWLYATAPAWWSARGIVNQGTPSDYAAVNQGQVKNLAKAAAAELDAHLPGGAGPAIHGMLSAWANPSAGANDFQAINLGQLKNLAKPFYDQFIANQYTDRYPWTASASAANDYALANIGQAKNLFGFDPSQPGAGLDLDHNGFSDVWEMSYFGHTGVDPDADDDGDGLNNFEEYSAKTNPKSKDTDGDGIDDAHDSQPTIPNPMAPVHLGIRVPSLEAQQAAIGGLDWSKVDYGSIEVQWKPATNGVAPTSFRVDRSLDGITWSTFKTVNSTVSSAPDTGLLANCRYQYRVTAIRANGALVAESFGAIIKYSPPTRLRVLSKESTPPFSPRKQYWAQRQFTPSQIPEYYLTVFEESIYSASPPRIVLNRTFPSAHFREWSTDYFNSYVNSGETSYVEAHYRWNTIVFGADNLTQHVWGSDLGVSYDSKQTVLADAGSWLGLSWSGELRTYSGTSSGSNLRSTQHSDGSWTNVNNEGHTVEYYAPAWVGGGTNFCDCYSGPSGWLSSLEDKKLVVTNPDGSSSFTTTLSDSYSTTALITDAVNDLPDYPLDYSLTSTVHLVWSYVNGEGSQGAQDWIGFAADSGYWDTQFNYQEPSLGYETAFNHYDPSRDLCDYRKVQYYFAAAPSAPTTVKLYEIFAPDDDPATPLIDERENVKLLNTITLNLDGGGSNSPLTERVPAPKDLGSFRLLIPWIDVGPVYTGVLDSPMTIGNEATFGMDTNQWPAGTTYSWNADGPAKITGPSGTGAGGWRLSTFGGNDPAGNSVLTWPPGSYTVKCVFSFPGGGGSITAERKVLVTPPPIEIRDVKDWTDETDDMIIEPKKDSTDTNVKSIAWIEPHMNRRDTDAAAYDLGDDPRMPQLEVRFPGLSAEATVQWKFRCKYSRPSGRELPEDDVKFPSNGSFKEVAGDQPWKIHQEYNDQPFFGGDVELTYKITGAGGVIILPEKTDVFRIAGKNPDNTRARLYLSSREPDLWFTYAICKHETAEFRYAGTFYNQFVGNPNGKTLNYSKYSRKFLLTYGEPTWNWDYKDSVPGGFGLFQVTGWQGNKNGNVPRDVIWNWQKNMSEGANEIRRDKVPAATNYFKAVKSKYGKNISDPSLTITGKSRNLTGWEVSVIVRYNGVHGLDPHPELAPYLGKNTQDPWTYSSGDWHGPQPNSENYLYKVILEIE